MKHTLIFSILSLLTFASTTAQEVRRAVLNPDGTLSSEVVPIGEFYKPTLINNDQKENFPIGFPAHPNFKNQRGLTLADINGDGIHEIFHAFGNKLIAVNDDGTIMWEKALTGVATYPPTVIDFFGDGDFMIAQPTGGSPPNGRVFLIDAGIGEIIDGWPLNFNNNMILSAISVADLTGNGIPDLVFCERAGTQGRIHAVTVTGAPISDSWPIEVPGTPAVTPSIADINNDGIPDIVFALSSGTYYAVDSSTGEPLEGFPVTLENRKFSYQSPVLVDLDGDDFLEIIAASHGDEPGFFVLNHKGEILDGWPHNLEGWTYTPPTVADVNGDGKFELFFSDRYTDYDGNETPVIFAFDKDGNPIEEMSVIKYGGTEGVMTIADINDDGVMDIIFPSVMTEDDHGFIHAYALDGSGQLEGFPKRPRGYTFMNGAVLGATTDGKLKMVANSHTMFYGTQPDSTFINVYELNVPYNPDKILWNGYKGDNTRSGFVQRQEIVSTPDIVTMQIQLFPNPTGGRLILSSPTEMKSATLQLIGLDGKNVKSLKNILIKKGRNDLDLDTLPPGLYILTLSDGKSHFTQKILVK